MYNSERTAHRAIESILNQTYKNFKLVIVDDNSTDNSLNIATSYTNDPRVSVLHNNKNMGAYYSRNAGLFYFKNYNWGLFTTHDADDISYPERYLRMIKALGKQRCVAVQDTFTRIDLNTRENLGTSLTMAHAMFRRSVFEALGYFEQVRFGADWEYWHRLSTMNRTTRQRTTVVTDVVGESLIHENNLTTTIPLKSAHRRNYINKTKKEVEARSVRNYWYRDFQLDNHITVVVKK